MVTTNVTPTSDNTNQGKPIKGYGPDGKLYTFKPGTTKEQASDWFKKKGIKAPAKTTSSNNQSNKPSGAGGSYTPESGVKTAARIGLKELPNIGGTVGSIMGGGVGPTSRAGAAIGGIVGDAAKQIGMRILFSPEPNASKEFTWKVIKQNAQDLFKEEGSSLEEMARAGGTQAALQFGGEKLIGGPFFKLLNKIPHATKESIQVGINKIEIPLLPGDVKGGVMKYVEQFLTSYLPSSGPMTDFITKQTAKITQGAEIIANGMSKFKGTPEQFGQLLQQSVEAAKKVAFNKMKPQLAKMTPQAFDIAMKQFEKEWTSGLLGKIASSNNVEQLSGTLISKGIGHEEIRELITKLSAADKQATFNAAKTAILGDGIKITLTGKADPAALKAGTQFAGKEFTNWLNSVGKGRLETIYPAKQLANIMKFDSIISNVGGQSGFVGKFANLVFVLGRGLSSSMGVTNLMKQVALTRTMAKIITSDTGIAAYENYVRALGAQAPRALKMAVDGIKVEVDKANQEYQKEQQQIDEQYKKGAK